MKSSVGGHAEPTPTQYLKGFWPAHDGSGNAFSERSGKTNDLNANGTVSAGFWTNPAKPSFENATTDYMSDGDTSNIEIGGANTSCIISLRLNLAATTAVTSVVFGKQESDASAGITLSVAEIAAVTALRSEYKVATESTKNVIAGGAIDDGADHHVVYFHDRGGNRGIYVDGADAVTGGVIDMADSVLAQSAVSPTSHFMVGARGTTASKSGPLASVNAVQKMKVWDCHAYVIEGSLPSDYLTLIGWLYKHPYQFITSDMW
jgi:hypothetical protein